MRGGAPRPEHKSPTVTVTKRDKRASASVGDSHIVDLDVAVI